MTGSLDAQTVRDALNRLLMCAHSRQELGCFLCDAHNELDRLVASVKVLTSDHAEALARCRTVDGECRAAEIRAAAAEARVVALTAELDKQKAEAGGVGLNPEDCPW